MPFRLLLTLFFLLFISTSPGEAQNPVKIKKVVIDAGHGGHDPGAVSSNRRILEKNITLSVALKLGKMISTSYPDIDVVYTRSNDRFIPLNERSEIANRNKADLFISIHVNSARSKSAAGSETFVMGMDKGSSNLEVSMLENSVITLEGEDYESKYEGFDPNNPESYIIFSLLQNAYLEQSLIMASLIQKHSDKGPIKINRGIKQAEFLVLWKTTMPAVLVELGFLSNSSDLPQLLSADNHVRFAENIFNAFKEFRSQYENGRIIEPVISEGTIKKDSTKYREGEKTSYRVQIMAITKVLDPKARDFKGEKNVNYIKSGKFYKYTVGNYDTPEEAEKELERLSKKFNGAFIIKIEKGVPVQYKRK
jgi:N-acetylmuramoyl-L-alanine amidase